MDPGVIGENSSISPCYAVDYHSMNRQIAGQVMNDKKMISIDQFTPQEREEIDVIYQSLVEKYRQRTSKEPDSKKDKEFTLDARQQVMELKLSKEKALAAKAKKPVRRKKPESLSASEVSDFNWSASVAKGRRR